MSDDRHTPGPPEQLLAGPTAHVGHVRVVYGKAEDPGGHQSKETGSQKCHLWCAQCLWGVLASTDAALLCLPFVQAHQASVMGTLFFWKALFFPFVFLKNLNFYWN